MEFTAIKTLSGQYDHKRPILTKLRAISVYDESPDLSYLEDGDAEYAEEDRARLEAYGESWWCVGIRVKATFVIPHDGHGFCLHEHTIQSSGLWGIDSDSGRDYFESVASDEWQELKRELDMMNVVIPDGIEIEYEF